MIQLILAAFHNIRRRVIKLFIVADGAFIPFLIAIKSSKSDYRKKR